MEDKQESTDEAAPEIDNLHEETQNETDLEDYSTASLPTCSFPSPCTSARKSIQTKRKATDSISKLLDENKKAREKIFETFMSKNSEDDVDMFYKSIALSVKRLPPHLISQAKMQHLQIVNNLELLASQSKNLPEQSQINSMDLSYQQSQCQRYDDQVDQIGFLNL